MKKDPNNKERQEPDKEGLAQEHQQTFETEREDNQPPKLGDSDLESLRQEVENTDIDDSLKSHVQTSANSIKLLDDQKKIEHLLQLAKAKGIIFAVHVAKKMNDAYVLDMLHDTLAKEGLYKAFLK